MTDIIDKVAEAISLRMDADHDASGDSWADFWPNFQNLATAALEALAEDALQWGVSRKNSLFMRSRLIGAVYYCRGQGVFSFSCCGEDDDRDFQTESEAKTALLNHARRTLFGLGPVGEDG